VLKDTFQNWFKATQKVISVSYASYEYHTDRPGETPREVYSPSIFQMQCFYPPLNSLHKERIETAG